MIPVEAGRRIVEAGVLVCTWQCALTQGASGSVDKDPRGPRLGLQMSAMRVALGLLQYIVLSMRTDDTQESRN